PFNRPLTLDDILEHHLPDNEDSFLIEETDSADVSSTSVITSNTEHSTVRKAEKKTKVAPVRAYIDQKDGKQKCKLCPSQWGMGTATSTMDRHFEKYHEGAFREMHQQRIDKMHYVP